METNMITEHFSMEEMTHSSTLDEYNRTHGTDFNNNPVLEEIDALKHLCIQLEELRKEMGCPLFVSSGYRNSFVNRLVGGSTTSLHMHGLAADLILPHDTMMEFAVKAMNNPFTKEVFLSYNTKTRLGAKWVHIGVEMEEMQKCRVGVDINGKVYSCIHYKQL